jgi:hypothetical protein
MFSKEMMILNIKTINQCLYLVKIEDKIVIIEIIIWLKPNLKLKKKKKM